ncbi:MAG: metalloregulator ArsR/SmtB family transcription factor [Clostridia bacterium]|nr:metalloregulator ArsR/SmtB family transcription factor [Clostridia bacterium]
MNRELFIARRVFAALANERRLMILSHLKQGPMGLQDFVLALGTSPTTLIQHLKVLTKSGLVTAQKQGRKTTYFISEEGSANAISLLQNLTTIQGDQGDV